VPAYPDSWFWMLDTDTVITNPHVPVRDFLPSSTYPQVVIGQDCNALNSGSFFIRSSKWSKWCAEYMLSLPEGEVQPLYWWANSAIYNTYKYADVSKYVWIAPIYWFNAYPEDTKCKGESGTPWRPWKQDDLLVHAAGLSPERKTEFLRQYRSKVYAEYTEPSVSGQEIDSWWL
jgi:galactosyl transferase GMA12/MNN10 family